MEFDWDEEKARSNLEKHKVSFELASEIFAGAEVLSFEDDRVNYGEVREIALGELDGVVLYVVFTVRDGRLRLISARKASRKEALRYYEHFPKRAT